MCECVLRQPCLIRTLLQLTATDGNETRQRENREAVIYVIARRSPVMLPLLHYAVPLHIASSVGRKMSGRGQK